MKLEGLWTPKEVLSFGEEGAYWRPIQECLADDTLDDEMKMFMSCKLLFDTDGMIKMLSPIPDRAPQEENRRAAEAGQVQLYDNRTMIVEQRPYKEENGAYYFDSGIQGEVLGEKVYSWMKIEETEDGIEWMTYRLVKAEP